MSIPPRVASKLNETLGPDAAEDLVNWLDEMRAEHRELRDAVRADFAEMSQEMLAMEARLTERFTAQIHAMDTRMGERIQAVEVDLGRRIGDVGKEVERSSANLIRWSFVFWVGAVAAIAALADVLRS